MLISDRRAIGDRLYAFRKNAGLTQAEAAELAEISDRAYAEIERGTVNMRVETMVRICNALRITPNELFPEVQKEEIRFDELMARLQNCTDHQQTTAFRLLNVYMESLK